MFFLIIFIALPVILICLFWLILYFPFNWLFTREKANKPRWFFAIISGIACCCYFLLSSPAYNNDSASLNSRNGHYELILTGERSLMVHDPISAFLRQTYTDTTVLILPRKTGRIAGNEIHTEGTGSLKGTIEISKKKVSITLKSATEDGRLKDFDYNGIYRLK